MHAEPDLVAGVVTGMTVVKQAVAKVSVSTVCKADEGGTQEFDLWSLAKWQRHRRRLHVRITLDSPI